MPPGGALSLLTPLRAQVLAHDAAVQAAGVPLLQQLEALADAHQTVEGVREVQSLLGHCASRSTSCSTSGLSMLAGSLNG